ncbi:tRNA 4-thiouridine(8) synthase ThiI [Candidatus Kaiserbacteria bacterium]|nr:MAG: tRNA 4-thiouridine(8) synthase ThiI [Candidatus Kaiserbacteria bacterium]
MKRVGIIHYDEIALKGSNRDSFEQTLVNNVARKIAAAEIPLTIENRWGRMIVTGAVDGRWKDEYDEPLNIILAHTPGVSVFGIGYMVGATQESIFEGITEIIKNVDTDSFETFRVSTTRVDKSFPDTSQDFDRIAGSHAQGLFNGDKKVQLAGADVVIRVEILKDRAYVYIKEYGLSGLAVGSSGKAVALLSGGFDSPVATHMCATRGVETLLMHFHAYPQTSRAAIEKVEDLAKVLSDVCGPLTLTLVPLLYAQKEIALVAPEKLRVILYRRLMMKAAEKWGRDNGAKAIITGESIGQVASQTLENMGAVEDATTLPILRPLAGMHKKDIIKQSKVIGTHDISVLPHDDTCTVFMPKRPETKARLDGVLKAEELYDSQKLVDDMLEQAEVREV